MPRTSISAVEGQRFSNCEKRRPGVDRIDELRYAAFGKPARRVVRIELDCSLTCRYAKTKK
jgi:hypothetical protein